MINLKQIEKRWVLVGGLCLVISSLGVIASLMLENSERELAYERQRSDVLREGTILRVRMESIIHSTFYLVSGLATYISSNPDITEEEFVRFSKPILENRPGLMNVAAAPDMVIRYVYPLAGNEAVLGFDYQKNEAQRDAALRVKFYANAVIAGPVDLVQGGSAFIGRFPVYVNRNGERDFWGIVSTPLDTEVFFREAGLLNASLSVEVGIRGKDALGQNGAMILGEEALFEDQEKVSLPVSLLSGEWQLAMRPKDGWVTEAPNRLLIRVGVALLVLLLFSFVGLIYLYILGVEKSREAEARGNRAKSEFLAIMSHEIRTPLHGILGVSGLVLNSDLDEEQRELIEMMRDSGIGLTSVLDDILEMSRLEGIRSQVDYGPIALIPFLNSVMAPIRVLTVEKGIALKFSGVPDRLNIIHSDETRLRKVIWNLLSNAMKFTKKGEIALEVDELGPVGELDKRIRISVMDTGVGISKDRLESVFEAFVQEDSSTTRNYGGSGLGLAIVKGIVTELGGTITVQSEKGKGSRFEVILPLRNNITG